MTTKALGKSFNTTAKAVDVLVSKGILVQTEKAGRSRTFSYEDYLQILRKDTDWSFSVALLNLQYLKEDGEIESDKIVIH